MLSREPRRRELSSLVATLLPRKTRGDLLQTQKLLQLAIAICGKQKTIDDSLYFYRVNDYSVTKTSAKEKMLRSHLRCAEIAKQYYDSESKKELKTVRFLHCELEYVMTLVSRLTYERRKEYLHCILLGELLPFMGIKPVLISIYTNIHSMHLKIVCLLSKTKIFSWRIKLWSKIWNSKAKKKIEKKIKSVIKQ